MEYDILPAVVQNSPCFHLNYKAGKPIIGARHGSEEEGSDLKAFNFSDLKDLGDQLSSRFKQEQSSDMLQLPGKYKSKNVWAVGIKNTLYFFFNFDL